MLRWGVEGGVWGVGKWEKKRGGVVSVGREW